MVRRGLVTAAAVAIMAMLTSAAVAHGGVELSARFDRGVQLGSATAIHAVLRVDPRRLPSPATEIRVFYPDSLGVASSGLGLAPCGRPEQDFQAIIIDAPGLGGCPRNAVMAYGSAQADVRLSDGQVIREFATVTILSGEIRDGALGLVIYVDGQHPFGGKLVYAGEIGAARGRFGGTLVARLPKIPALEGVATVALVDMRLAIGSRKIIYNGRTGPYHPHGVVLPTRCPKHGFPFRAEVVFEDGHRETADAPVACPRAAAR